MSDLDRVLSDEEFDLLTDDEQERYLALIEVEAGEWTLHPKQILAERIADQTKETLYGGAAGGGKSEWLLYRAHRMSSQIPGHATLLLRSAFPELRRSLIRRSIELFARVPRDERPRWRAADKEWRYQNGSVIEFGYAESDDDVGQYLSAEYDMIGFDELTEFTEYQFNMIRSRARTTTAKKRKGVRPHVIGATNPGRRGHEWVKQHFVEQTHFGDDIVTLTETLPDGREFHRTIGFIPATVMDNPHIDPEYVNVLLSLPEAQRKQYLEGDWDTFEGMYFPEFKKTIVEEDGSVVAHHVIDPFPIPRSWPRIRGIDYGFARPYCCVWVAFDNDGYAYLYRTDYRMGLRPSEQAQSINALSVAELDGVMQAEHIDYTRADPSMWTVREGSPSVAAQYAQEGVFLLKADNDRINGWARVREYLAVDDTGTPGLRIFSTCTPVIKELAAAIHDEKKPEDLDTHMEFTDKESGLILGDHALDATRYALMSRPRKHIVKQRAQSGMQEAVWADIQGRARKQSRAYHPVLGRGG